jgi:hypothetical protein
VNKQDVEPTLAVVDDDDDMVLMVGEIFHSLLIVKVLVVVSLSNH